MTNNLILFTNDKILGRSKGNIFADDTLPVAKLLRFGYERLENTIGKREIAYWLSAASPFSSLSSKALIFRVTKT